MFAAFGCINTQGAMKEKAKTIVQNVSDTPAFKKLLARIDESSETPAVITGLSGSLLSVLLARVQETTGKTLFFITSERESAERVCDDLRVVLQAESVHLFSGSHSRERNLQDSAHTDEGVRTLKGLMDENARVVASTVDALRVTIAKPGQFSQQTITLSVGNEYSFGELVGQLSGLGFQKDDYVRTRGEYSVRGGILDVFPYAGDDPLRIEFLGDTVESIRLFDPLSQRSIRDLSVAVIVPDLLSSSNEADSATLLDYAPRNGIVVLDDPDRMKNEQAEEWSRTEERLAGFSQLRIYPLRQSLPGEVDFGSLMQPAFNGSVRHFREKVAELQREGYTILLTADSHSEEQRLRTLLLESVDAARDNGDGVPAVSVDVDRLHFSQESLHEGFLLPDLRLAVFTEHQIFNRVKRKGRKRKTRFKGFSQEEIQRLQKGDYVVHMDYGIGVYDGLHRIRVKNVEQEVVKVQYDEGDTLYVHLSYINRLQKYASKEGHLPRLTRLGSKEWERLKARAKKRIKDIARDLIRLYARRRHLGGFGFAPDTLWQKEMEASFMYEDTFDQAKATKDVKTDMEAAHPMDRLICGDVGFGKTEVAVRAAFKAVMNGKQVAVLVPTTILAIQHYNTFMDRMTRYATRVQVLSRFKSKKEQQAILRDLGSGAIDVIIGTHRLLSKDVRLKDLGLLIIDEEHRFGVTAKEKLRQLKAEVDTLTLTATPIPRTLHFSLMGARDLSIIATPPRNRLPVITEISPNDDALIREAILREVQRHGQVYFVHDRVQNIDQITSRLQGLLPTVRFRTAHGQLPGHQLEEVMLDFLEKRFDVLVCTKIIESGLDIPNANTIIVNRADRFGMAELYQLRGRVGRSNVQAYAYLLTPPFSVLPRGTIQRLQAVEEHTDLGSGFHLAMRDLEIRGTGNLLGAEQSGFVEDMGFETYTRILEESVAELKAEEFRELFEREVAEQKPHVDAIVEADLDALIPEEYVGHPSERLALYRKLYGVRSTEQLTEMADEMRDRFGGLPPEVENLLQVVRLKLAAGSVGFTRVNVSENLVEIEFPPETTTRFYESDLFQQLMARIGDMRAEGVSLRQEGNTLMLTARPANREGVPLSYAMELVRRLAGETTTAVPAATRGS
jgi:transcription-repair coupling factor (superfamily II helicase)